MMKKYLLFLFVLTVKFAISQDCNCKVNFEWMKNIIENNDAGFKYVINAKGKDAYDYHNNLILKEIENANTYEDCRLVMKDWLRFFRQFHLNISLTDSVEKITDSVKQADYRNLFKDIAASTITNHEKFSITEKDWGAYLANIKDPGFEGIWSFPPRYKIGIIRKGSNYIGFILDGPEGVPLQRGSVNLKIYPEGDGYKATVFGSDLSKNDSATVVLRDNRYMNVGNFYFEKISPIYPNSKEKQVYYSYLESSKPIFELLSGKTAYLRLPSFAFDQKRLIDSVLEANDTIIRKTPNLIIDIRHNGGGADASYQELTKYIYTNPLHIMPVNVYASPLNNRQYLKWSQSENFGQTDRIHFRELYEKLEKHIGQYVMKDSNKATILTLPGVLPNPKNVAILIDGITGSSAEQLVIDFRESKKVKVFGQSSLGSIDFSNMNSVTSPGNEFKLSYAMTVSSRIPEYRIDATGVQPDYFIGNEYSDIDWVPYVKTILEED